MGGALYVVICYRCPSASLCDRSPMSSLPLQDVPLPPGAKRDAALPVLKKVAPGYVHPLRAQSPQAQGVTYVYQFERDKQKAKDRHAKSRTYRIPEPFEEGLLNAGTSATVISLQPSICELMFVLGFIGLQPGDAVFARPPGGKKDGTDDVLQVMVLKE